MAPRKRAQKSRQSAEFPVGRLMSEIEPPRNTAGSSAYTWTIDQIRAARDAQLRGDFARPAQMAASMRTDDALFTAYDNRLAPQRCIDVAIVPSPTGPQEKARMIAGEAEALFGRDGIALPHGVIADINGDIANHGLAVAICHYQPRDDGSRVDVFVDHWPIEFVRWDPISRQLVTKVEVAAGSRYDVPITHGDGRWAVFANHSSRPWQQGACILSAALIWARHAHGVRDWARGSTSHGNAKVIGEMPEGMPIRKHDGTLTQEAEDFMTLLRAVASLESPVGLRPAGAKTDYVTNTSNALQVWHELVTNAEKAAARVYLGTDGTLGAQGGAPGVDIATLFGVATTKVQGDLRCIERGLLTGVIEPWCAINWGDSSLAPSRRYMMPDADADAVRRQYAGAAAAFHEDVRLHRENGFELTQDVVNELAERYGVRPPTIGELPPVTAAPDFVGAEEDEEEPESDARLRLMPLKRVSPFGPAE
jgi:phage gp29-like protein